MGRLNLHQLTKKQHIVPRRSIARFCNEAGLVRVTRKNGKTFLAKPENAGFCAPRLWEERSENGHKTIEDTFQAIADRICIGDLDIPDLQHSHDITAMFALWAVRSHLVEANDRGVGLRNMPGLKGFSSGADLSGWSSDERDQLEKAGYVISNPDGSIPGRMLAWPHMQRKINAIYSKVRGMKWGVLRAGDGQFLMPDRYRQTWILPLSPTTLLAAGRSEETLSADAVAKVNSLSMSEYRMWFLERP
ncbi:hypothetical protein [Rhizobium tubonense]|uniref:DUF4238 domain-containing protein n=1 Tax=Rhizobium tubonense TaxID=484088 RepID=A0A2W4CIL8_9HYPH|nr:hypothetical protein [Rhizobium tubonense]PZM12897.1 hypothetical protein CPY51_15255 [Rhizobium tubonense]